MLLYLFSLNTYIFIFELIIKYMFQIIKCNFKRQFLYFYNSLIKNLFIGLKLEKDIKMALQKVKGNIERMFDKNLTDLVRGIR